jgi:hypothetical protein
MKSVASVKSDPTKFNWTTGTVTLRNYIQKKAGQKAEFHHCYGALLVEVDSTGAWGVRQLLADELEVYDPERRLASFLSRHEADLESDATEIAGESVEVMILSSATTSLPKRFDSRQLGFISIESYFYHPYFTIKIRYSTREIDCSRKKSICSISSQ